VRYFRAVRALLEIVVEESLAVCAFAKEVARIALLMNRQDSLMMLELRWTTVEAVLQIELPM